MDVIFMSFENFCFALFLVVMIIPWIVMGIAEIFLKKRSKDMGEWSPFTLSEFEWEVLKLYIKHGHGDVKLYNTSFFTSSLTDKTVCMTLKEFAEKAVNYDDFPWMYIDDQALKQMEE